jgi:hypothetical protein
VHNRITIFARTIAVAILLAMAVCSAAQAMTVEPVIVDLKPSGDKM